MSSLRPTGTFGQFCGVGLLGTRSRVSPRCQRSYGSPRKGRLRFRSECWGSSQHSRALFPGIYDTALFSYILIHILPENSKREKALKYISRILFLFGDKIQPLSIYGQNLLGIVVHSDQPLYTDCPRGTWACLSSLLCSLDSGGARATTALRTWLADSWRAPESGPAWEGTTSGQRKWWLGWGSPYPADSKHLGLVLTV